MSNSKVEVVEERKRKRPSRSVPNPVFDVPRPLEWKDFGFDESRKCVLDVLNGPASTRKSLLYAATRFENFLERKKRGGFDFVLGEALLIEYYEHFLYCLTNPRTNACVYEVGSFFPVMSLTKVYLSRGI